MNDRALYILNKNETIIGKLRERDGVTDCFIDNKQNTGSTLSFNISVKSDKYPLLSDAENLIFADGRVYTFIYDGDSVAEKKSTDNKNIASITMTERQYLLSRVFVQAYNSTTSYDHMDLHMVVILSGGKEEPVINGQNVNIPYERGTAAYALYAVLYDTEWDVGTVDVTGTFDLETDKKSVLDNVKAIQSLWGGILVFDSVNKVIHLRSEEAYQPYNGYGVRFRFNETGLERTINRSIITRLYVYGKDNLNIAKSNEGKEYLENYSYTSTPLYGIMVNNDITNVGDLIVWGRRELEKVCKPQVALKVSLVDRSYIDGGPSFGVSDIVDVVDEDLSSEKYQARVTEKKYDFFRPYDCTVALGDAKEVFAAKVRYVLETAGKVSNLIDLVGKISSDDIIMSGTKVKMTSYVQLTNAALEAGFKVIGVDGYERTGKTTISIDGIDVYNGGIVVRDRDNNIRIYMDGSTGNIIFSGDLYGANGTFAGALEAATGTFAGELKAATGSFEGEITAKEGYIGSWQILNNGIVNKNSKLALTASGEIIASSGNFMVGASGKMYAKGAEITGSFKAQTENSSVEFSDETMYLNFVGINEATGLPETACMISPTEFYFICFDEDGETVKSAIQYSNGQLEITGKITATSGEIGGWLIEEDCIKSPTNSLILYADGRIEGCDGIDGASGEIVSLTNNEKTVIKGGRINMYKWNADIDNGKGKDKGGWEHEASIYTNENLGGGLCLSAVDGRPVTFAVGGNVVMRLIAPVHDDEGNVTEEAYLDFRSGTRIYKKFVETGYVKETDPEWFKKIEVSDTSLVFTSGNRTYLDNDTLKYKKYRFGLTRDADGRITGITDESGHVTQITRS